MDVIPEKIEKNSHAVFFHKIVEYIALPDDRNLLPRFCRLPYLKSCFRTS